jgi:hypothetical protein
MVERLPALLPWSGATEEEARTLLSLGQYFIAGLDVWLAGLPTDPGLAGHWLDTPYRGDPADLFSLFADDAVLSPPPDAIGLPPLPTGCAIPLARVGTLLNDEEITALWYEAGQPSLTSGVRLWQPPALVTEWDDTNLDQETTRYLLELLERRLVHKQPFDRFGPPPAALFLSQDVGSPDDLVPSEHLVAVCDAVSTEANQWLGQVDCPPVLRLRIAPIDNGSLDNR